MSYLNNINDIYELSERVDAIEGDIYNISPISGFLYSDGKTIVGSDKLKEEKDTLLISSKINNIIIPGGDSSEFVLNNVTALLTDKILQNGCFLTSAPLINYLPDDSVAYLRTAITTATSSYAWLTATSLACPFYVCDIENGYTLGAQIFSSRIAGSDLVLAPGNISCAYFLGGKTLMSEPITKRIVESNIIDDGNNLTIPNGFCKAPKFTSDTFDSLVKLLISSNDKSICQCDDIIYDQATKKFEGTYADMSMKKIYSTEFFNCKTFTGFKMLMSDATQNIIEAPSFGPFSDPNSPYIPNPVTNPLDYEIWLLWKSLQGPQGVQGPQGIQGPKGNTGEVNPLISVAASAAGGILGGMLGNLFNWDPIGLLPKPADVPPFQIDEAGDLMTKGEISTGSKINQYDNHGNLSFQVSEGNIMGSSLAVGGAVSAGSIASSGAISSQSVSAGTITSTTTSANIVKCDKIELSANDVKISNINDAIVFETTIGQIQNKAIDSCIIGDLFKNRGTFTKITCDSININDGNVMPTSQIDKDGLDLNISGGDSEINEQKGFNGGNVNINGGKGDLKNGNVNIGQQYTNNINFFAPTYFYNNCQFLVRTIAIDTLLDNTYSTIIADTTNNNISITLPAITIYNQGLQYTISKKSNNNILTIHVFSMLEKIFQTITSIDLTNNGDNIKLVSDPSNNSWN